MKNLSLILNGILAVAVAVLYYLHFSCAAGCSTSKMVVTDSLSIMDEDAFGDSAMTYIPDSLPPAGNVAFLNFEVLTEKYQFYKDGVKALEADFKNKQTELATKTKKWEEDVMRYQQLAAGMNEETRAGKEQQLAADEKKLYEYRDALEGSFSGKEAEFNKAFLTKLDGYFSKLGKEKNYDYVFVYSKGGPSYIVYANDKLNITNYTLQGLNSQYKKK